LQGDRLKSEIFDLLDEFLDQLIEAHFDNAEADQIREEMLLKLLVDVKIEPEEFEKLGKDGLKNKLLDASKEFYRRKEEMLYGVRLDAAMLGMIDTSGRY
jgi:preprotein translocase subunit SecA